MWFTQWDGNEETVPERIIRVTSTGEFSSVTLADRAGVRDIAPGPDGNIWFTQDSRDMIGRVTPDGVLTEFPCGGPGHVCRGPSHIVAGPDGAMWYTMTPADKIGRITMSGDVKSFVLPYDAPFTIARLPEGIAVGADGNIWFTEPHHNQIGRMTLHGDVTEFPLPSDGGRPYYIAAGPDGALWFTEYPEHTIGRITTDGVITEYPLSTSIDLADIVTGHDGSLWFTAYTEEKVASLTPDGHLREISLELTAPCPNTLADECAGPVGIAPGPDGTMWFTENAADKVGVIDPAGEPRLQYISVLPSGFAPADATVTLGTRVQWSMFAAGVHFVRSSGELKVLRSRPLRPVSYFRSTMRSAGTFRYSDSSGARGTLSVPLDVLPATGTISTEFAVRWSTASAAEGDGFDVQVRRPGALSFVPWKRNTSRAKGSFVPDDGPGTYWFRARLRQSSDVAGQWSPPGYVLVG